MEFPSINFQLFLQVLRTKVECLAFPIETRYCWYHLCTKTQFVSRRYPINEKILIQHQEPHDYPPHEHDQVLVVKFQEDNRMSLDFQALFQVMKY